MEMTQHSSKSLKAYQKSCTAPKTSLTIARYETKETIKSIGKMIRQELLSAPDVFVSWPPGQNQLLQENFQTPELTKLLLTLILSEKGNVLKEFPI